MKEQRTIQFRLMTYNIGGGRKDFGSELDQILEVVNEVSPDILAVQEAAEWQDADGVWHSTARQLAEAARFEENFCFGPTLSMREHMHVRKARFVDAVFRDWEDWVQGNALFSRWGFVRLSDTSREGRARNVPLHKVPIYKGNRDTDPRYALLARVDKPPVFPFVVGLHLTTLLGERTTREYLSNSERALIKLKTEEAELIRYKQVKRLLDLLRHHVLEAQELAFLLGDFNAEADEACLSVVLEDEGGFIRLAPRNFEDSTHPKSQRPIDHIFVYPERRIVKYDCWLVDDEGASDHSPVVADVEVSFA